jgi:hypothetical protein
MLVNAGMTALPARAGLTADTAAHAVMTVFFPGENLEAEVILGKLDGDVVLKEIKELAAPIVSHAEASGSLGWHFFRRADSCKTHGFEIAIAQKRRRPGAPRKGRIAFDTRANGCNISDRRAHGFEVILAGVITLVLRIPAVFLLSFY